jgi:hypothetical protein
VHVSHLFLPSFLSSLFFVPCLPLSDCHLFVRYTKLYRLPEVVVLLPTYELTKVTDIFSWHTNNTMHMNKSRIVQFVKLFVTPTTTTCAAVGNWTLSGDSIGDRFTVKKVPFTTLS